MDHQASQMGYGSYPEQFFVSQQQYGAQMEHQEGPSIYGNFDQNLMSTVAVDQYQPYTIMDLDYGMENTVPLSHQQERFGAPMEPQWHNVDYGRYGEDIEYLGSFQAQAQNPIKIQPKKSNANSDFVPLQPTRTHQKGAFDHLFQGSKTLSFGPGRRSQMVFEKLTAQTTVIPRLKFPVKTIVVPRKAPTKRQYPVGAQVSGPSAPKPAPKEPEEDLIAEFFYPVEAKKKEKVAPRAPKRKVIRREKITQNDEEAFLALLAQT